MLLKILNTVLFFAMVASLFTSFSFLRKDFDKPESKRALYALGVRLAIAAALISTIAYGFLSGRLQSKAPWDYAEVIPEQTQTD